MPKYKVPVYDPKLQEYLYDLLSKASFEELRRLSSAELALVSTDKSLRKFIGWAGMDKKLALLTKMNIWWSLQFCRTPGVLNELQAKAYKQHRFKGQRTANIETMAKNGVFVVTNKEFALSLSLLAQDSHSDIYFLNPNFIKVAEAVSDIRKIAKPLGPEYIKTKDSFNTAAKFFFETLMIDSFVQANGLQPIDIRVLFWLYPQANNHVHVEAIQRAIVADYKPQTVAKTCNTLWANGYIDKLPTESVKPSYTITAKGINFVGRVMQRVVDISTGR